MEYAVKIYFVFKNVVLVRYAGKRTASCRLWRIEGWKRRETAEKYIQKAIADAGFRGCAGLEYFPVRDAEAGLRQWRETFPAGR